MFNTQHSTLNTQHSTLNTQHSTLNTQHSTLNTQHSTLNTQHSTLKLLAKKTLLALAVATLFTPSFTQEKSPNSKTTQIHDTKAPASSQANDADGDTKDNTDSTADTSKKSKNGVFIGANVGLIPGFGIQGHLGYRKFFGMTEEHGIELDLTGAYAKPGGSVTLVGGGVAISYLYEFYQHEKHAAGVKVGGGAGVFVLSSSISPLTLTEFLPIGHLNIYYTYNKRHTFETGFGYSGGGVIPITYTFTF